MRQFKTILRSYTRSLWNKVWWSAVSHVFKRLQLLHRNRPLFYLAWKSLNWIPANSAISDQSQIWVSSPISLMHCSKQIYTLRRRQRTVSSWPVIEPVETFNGDSCALCPQEYCVRRRSERNGCSSIIRSEHCVRHSRPRHSTHSVTATVRCLWHSSDMASVVSVRLVW